ncbi:DUF4369 domain-containing protein [Flavobacterium pallidum]|uniref:DUF4369 domain-containing protein n=1 Tax=Flavobacterium pallidum TaxID=2172098 RepID=A0A2S1SH82_9FLAO|nr:DUF4369 domain-containing protein [Flavobacterium pallidum]AWI25702.1 hypothetical protein HYN49_07205 [Flavobacterium pallidum]
MKKILGAMAVCLLLLSCQKEKPKGNLHLTGNIEGLKKGTLYITRLGDSSFVSVDTIKIDGDSHFESWLDIKSPEMYYIVLDRGKTNSIDDRLPFFAEAGKMNIETTLEQFYAQAKITGSKNQQLLDDYKKVNDRFTSQNLDITELLLRKQHAKVAVNADSIARVQDYVLKRKYLYAAQFALNNKDHEIAPYIVLSEINENATVVLLDRIRKALTPKVANSYYGKKLTQYYNERKKAEQQ